MPQQIQDDTFQVPTFQNLRDQARAHLRLMKPKAYKQAVKDGDLEEWIDGKARAAQNLAENLHHCGATPEEAWNRAIREEILDSPDTD